MQGGSDGPDLSAQGSTWLVLNALVSAASALAGGGFGEARGWRSRSSSGMAFHGRLTIFFSPGRSAAMSFVQGRWACPDLGGFPEVRAHILSSFSNVDHSVLRTYINYNVLIYGSQTKGW